MNRAGHRSLRPTARSLGEIPRRGLAAVTVLLFSAEAPSSCSPPAWLHPLTFPPTLREASGSPTPSTTLVTLWGFFNCGAPGGYTQPHLTSHASSHVVMVHARRLLSRHHGDGLSMEGQGLGRLVTDQIRCGRRAASVSQGCARWTQLSASVMGVGDSGRAGRGCCLPGDTETVRVGDRGNSPPSPNTDVSSACLPASLPYGTPQGSRSGGDRGGRVGEPWFFSSWCSFTARLPWVQIPSLQEIDLLWLYLHYKHLGSLGL